MPDKTYSMGPILGRAQFSARGGTLGISGWGCAAGTLEPWPRTGPHTVRTRFLLSPQKSMQLFIWAALCHSIGSGYFRDPALI